MALKARPRGRARPAPICRCEPIWSFKAARLGEIISSAPRIKPSCRAREGVIAVCRCGSTIIGFWFQNDIRESRSGSSDLPSISPGVLAASVGAGGIRVSVSMSVGPEFKQLATTTGRDGTRAGANAERLIRESGYHSEGVFFLGGHPCVRASLRLIGRSASGRPESRAAPGENKPHRRAGQISGLQVKEDPTASLEEDGGERMAGEQ